MEENTIDTNWMDETIRNIKKELRANMNGIASSQMRRGGMPHHVVWGIELPRLRNIATGTAIHTIRKKTVCSW